MVTSPYRIMIVDNSKILRQGLRVVLEGSEDFRVVADTDRSAAIATAIDLKPHVVVADLWLPHVEDGFTMLSQLREKARDTRVIALMELNGYGDLVYQAIESGADGCLFKSSTDVAEIVEGIRQVARGRGFLSSGALQSLRDTIVKRKDSVADSTVVKSNGLSSREYDVLNLVVQGYTNFRIANELVISESTVNSHLHNILKKLKLTNRVQAAAFALGLRADQLSTSVNRQDERTGS
jgi:two-component system, NarL family, response regulator NreC